MVPLFPFRKCSEHLPPIFGGALPVTLAAFPLIFHPTLPHCFPAQAVAGGDNPPNVCNWLLIGGWKICPGVVYILGLFIFGLR